MKEIVLKERFAFLYCNQSLYSKNALKKTILEYSDFLKAQLEELGNYFVLKIERKNEDYELEELSYEFLNYALAQSFEEQ